MQLFELGDLYHVLYPKDVDSENLLQLHEIIRNNMNIRLRIILDIAKGMRYLHTLSPPIIHRDLRSPNIFVCISSFFNLFLIYYFKNENKNLNILQTN